MERKEDALFLPAPTLHLPEIEKVLGTVLPGAPSGEDLMRSSGYQRHEEIAEAAWHRFRNQHSEKSATDALLLALEKYGMAPLIASPSVQRFFISAQSKNPALYRSAIAALAGRSLPRPNEATKAELDSAASLYQYYMIIHRMVTATLRETRTTYVQEPPAELSDAWLRELSADGIFFLQLQRRVWALAERAPIDGADTPRRIAASFVCQCREKTVLGTEEAETAVNAAYKLLKKRQPELLQALKKIDSLLARSSAAPAC